MLLTIKRTTTCRDGTRYRSSFSSGFLLVTAPPVGQHNLPVGIAAIAQTRAEASARRDAQLFPLSGCRGDAMTLPSAYSCYHAVLLSLAATWTSSCSRSDAELSHVIRLPPPFCSARAAHRRRSQAGRRAGEGGARAIGQAAPGSRSSPAPVAFPTLTAPPGARPALVEKDHHMAKGQQRGNREARKPKKARASDAERFHPSSLVSAVGPAPERNAKDGPWKLD